MNGPYDHCGPYTPTEGEAAVERCRVLLDQWRKDRLRLNQDTTTALTLAECEDELREALDGAS